MFLLSQGDFVARDFDLWQSTDDSHHLPFFHNFEETGHYYSAVSWEMRTQKLKSHLVRTQNLNVLPLKPGVVSIKPHMLSLLPGISSLLIFTLPVHSPAFFPRPLLISPVLAVTKIWFLSRPAE